MRENICSKAQIDNIATELNAGRRTEAVDLINDCTQNLINDSAYGKFMKEHGDKVKAGEKPATNAATVLFDLVTAEESTMWKGMAKAADNKNPDGLCKMTVAKDKRGTFIEIGGKDCR